MKIRSIVLASVFALAFASPALAAAPQNTFIDGVVLNTSNEAQTSVSTATAASVAGAGSAVSAASTDALNLDTNKVTQDNVAVLNGTNSATVNAALTATGDVQKATATVGITGAVTGAATASATASAIANSAESTVHQTAN